MKPEQTIPAADACQDVIAEEPALIRQIESRETDIRFYSFGLEYIKALETLLALINEPQRTRLLDFIINNKIV